LAGASGKAFSARVSRLAVEFALTLIREVAGPGAAEAVAKGLVL
jgi:hypothetical protein